MKILLLLLIVSFSFAINLQKPMIYKGEESLEGWIMSEKLDGIRAYWDGEKLQTRKGKKIYAPKWFLKNFPKFELDGELWNKRDNFENIQSIVMDKTPTAKWKNITYNIFEVPNQKGDFFIRLKKAKNWFEKFPNKNVQIIKQIKIKNKSHLNTYLEEIISKKGEGVIIKNPDKEYISGRNPYILKVKKFKDMEGEVIKINISKKTNVLKSLTIKLQDNTIFNLGTGFSKDVRIKPPKIGSIVTFKYYGLTKNGKPKFASFLHIRKD